MLPPHRSGWKLPADDISVAVHTASTLFRQGTNSAMQRGNLEMASPVVPEIEAQLPEYGVFSSGYVFQDPTTC